VSSMLARIAEVNPRLNALVRVLDAAAMQAADAADRAVAAGAPLGPLHGVPVTTKVNVDQAGCPTDNGIVALRDLVATEDSPPVAALCQAGAIVVGRSNVPAFSLRWVSDNDLHGRTLNPWNPAVTPGGSSGGAAVAVAAGMGPIGHGNDLGGSIRYPAYCCGIVGLRPTSGRVAAFNATAQEERGIAPQLMSVQGPLARCVNDARLALAAMARPDPRDPLQVPAPLEGPAPAAPIRVALFRAAPGYVADPAVAAALDRAAAILARAGFAVEEAAPPHFEEAASLWRGLVHDDMRRSLYPAMRKLGDAAIREMYAHVFAGMGEMDRDAFLAALGRRLAIARAWSLFLQRFPLLLMPVSWQRPFRFGADHETAEGLEAVLQAQSPMLATAMLGLPGLSVPTGVEAGLPAGVQLVAARFREDLCLLAGEAIEGEVGLISPP
jgi:amidase